MADKEKADEEKLTRKSWLKEHGYNIDPFSPESVRAEADVLLGGEKSQDGSAFVEFPYYETILGDVGIPGPRFIFTERGGGKTALRIKIQKKFDKNLIDGLKNPILAVTYNKFDRVLNREEVNHNSKNVVPRHHVDEIIRLIVKGLFKALVVNQETFKDNVLNEERTKQLLNWYVTEYRAFQPWDLDQLLGDIYGAGYFFSEKKIEKLLKGGIDIVSSALPEVAQRAVETLTSFFSVEEPMSISKNDISIVEALEELIRLCVRIGFKAVYVLIDDVDEPQYYGKKLDFHPAFDLIKPLASAPKIIGISGLVFKFFLPIEIRPWCLQTFRLDKFSELVIKWTYRDLNNVYETRIEICTRDEKNDKRFHDLQALCGDDLAGKIDQWIVDFAKEMGNPRALIYVGNEMLVEHFRTERSKDVLIPRAAWERARQRAEEVLR